MKHLTWHDVSEGRRIMPGNKEHKKAETGDGEMAWGSRGLAALAEDMGLVPSSHMVAHDHL